LWLIEINNLFWHTEYQYVIIVNLFGRVLSCCHDGDGPQHIKVVLEWEYTFYKRYRLCSHHYCKNFTQFKMLFKDHDGYIPQLKRKN